MKRKLTLKCGLLSALISITLTSKSQTQNFSGPVGIETIIPAYPLDVNGIGQFAGGAKIGNGGVGFYGDGINHAVSAISSLAKFKTPDVMGQTVIIAGQVWILLQPVRLL